MEQISSVDKPPQDPDKGFRLKITPTDITVMATTKIKTPKKISITEIKLILT